MRSCAAISDKGRLPMPESNSLRAPYRVTPPPGPAVGRRIEHINSGIDLVDQDKGNLPLSPESITHCVICLTSVDAGVNPSPATNPVTALSHHADADSNPKMLAIMDFIGFVPKQSSDMDEDKCHAAGGKIRLCMTPTIRSIVCLGSLSH